MQPGGVTEQVTVTDAPSPINLSTQQTSGLVNERQVKDLPLNGRSYDQLITLNPAAVNYTAQRSGSVGTSNSSVGNMFAISGRRPQDNLYLLNGIEYTGASLINVTPGGTSGQLLGVDAVREFNVVTDTYSANYGKRQGAQISIVTASGTNNLHGSAYEFLRNSFFDSRNYFDQARIPNFQRNNYGASLGGPLRTDRLFLFGNYEGYRQNLGITDVTLVPDTQLVRDFSPTPATPAARARTMASRTASHPCSILWPAQNGPELLDANGNPTGIGEAYSSPTQHIREDFGTARFDANLTSNDLLFAVYTVDDSTANTPTQNPLSLIDESLREQVVSVQEQHVFSAHLLNTARIGYSRQLLFPREYPLINPGRNSWLPRWQTDRSDRHRRVHRLQWVVTDHLRRRQCRIQQRNGAKSLHIGRPRLLFSLAPPIQAGVWLQALQSNDNLAQNQFGQASFASLTTFLQGTVKTFTVVPNPTPLNWHSFMGAGYLEDTWQLTPTLNFAAASASNLRTAGTRPTVAPRNTASPMVSSTPHQLQATRRSLTTAQSSCPNPASVFAWNVFGNGRPRFAPASACTTRYSTTSTTVSIRPRLTTQLSLTPTCL